MTGMQAVFLDRDGTIGGTGHFIHPKHFRLYEGAQEAIFQLKEAGLKVFAFTNQHRISRGEATIEEFTKQFQQFGFDDAFICPHGVQKTETGNVVRSGKKVRIRFNEMCRNWRCGGSGHAGGA